MAAAQIIQRAKPRNIQADIEITEVNTTNWWQLITMADINWSHELMKGWGIKQTKFRSVRITLQI